LPGDICEEASRERFDAVASYLDSHKGPIRSYTPPNTDTDSVIECLTVVSGSYQHAQADCLRWPEVLRPVRGELRVTGKHHLLYPHLYHLSLSSTAFDTVFADCKSYHNGHGQAYQGYGIDEKAGCIVIIRPDQYVAEVLRMDQYEQIGEWKCYISLCMFALMQCNGKQATSSVIS